MTPTDLDDPGDAVDPEGTGDGVSGDGESGDGESGDGESGDGESGDRQESDGPGDPVDPAPPPEPPGEPRASRPPVSAGAAFVGGCGAFFGLIGVVCVGVSIAMTAVGLRETERGQIHERERIELRDAQLDEATALLDEVAEWLHAEHAATRRFPRALREQPPLDPWDNALLYTSSGLDRAELRCAGPDGDMDTLDDLVRTLKPR